MKEKVGLPQRFIRFGRRTIIAVQRVGVRSKLFVGCVYACIMKNEVIGYQSTMF